MDVCPIPSSPLYPLRHRLPSQSSPLLISLSVCKPHIVTCLHLNQSSTLSRPTARLQATHRRLPLPLAIQPVLSLRPRPSLRQPPPGLLRVMITEQTHKAPPLPAP
ncbi:hypothetical protein E2C01_015761 [Portunus trituberculatus]|uniref:Uncharacterized protein n=1 Tax=Portunus trituberculatus TaxID=210409 RepID=A0A5B7DMD7_PORTR|nr:hypothetical protein [Portunus trituberculatus]